MANRFGLFATMLCAVVLSSKQNLQAQKSDVKNIVFVHSACADGSGCRGVYNNLVGDGFNVSIVQEPETSFQDDVNRRELNEATIAEATGTDIGLPIWATVFNRHLSDLGAPKTLSLLLPRKTGLSQ